MDELNGKPRTVGQDIHIRRDDTTDPVAPTICVIRLRRIRLSYIMKF